MFENTLTIIPDDLGFKRGAIDGVDPMPYGDLRRTQMLYATREIRLVVVLGRRFRTRKICHHPNHS